MDRTVFRFKGNVNHISKMKGVVFIKFCSKNIFCIIQVIQMNVEESVRKQIAQELKINQSSQCTTVVVCYQSFYDNDAVSIILENMDGGSLADYLKTVRLIPEPYLAAICKQVGNQQLFLFQIFFIE